jgi:hypothetical protein
VSDSLRQQAIDAVKERFALILVANDYATNIGQTILEWQQTSVEDASLPLMIVRDEVEKTIIPESKNAGTYTRQLEITVDVVLAEADATATGARLALGDVINAVGVDDKWGGAHCRSLTRLWWTPRARASAA